jgi:hypothetical protein
MQLTDLSDTERVVAAGFATGTEVDVTGRPDPGVRGEVLRFILLGGVTAQPGDRAELRLTGARVAGAFEVEFADLDAPMTLKRCSFDGPISFFGSHLRRLTLDGSEFPSSTSRTPRSTAQSPWSAVPAPGWSASAAQRSVARC